MAIRTYTVASRTYRLGRVVEIGETIQLEEALADGDDTLVKMPAETADTTNAEGLSSDKVDPEPALPEPDAETKKSKTKKAD
jgi:hypothetical protein